MKGQLVQIHFANLLNMKSAFFKAATLGLTGLALGSLSAAALALDVKPFDSKTLDELQRSGKPVAVLFHADWCPTCKLQEKRVAELIPDKKLALTLLVADYDKEKELKTRMKVRSQSTFVIFKGDKEVNRAGGITKADDIREALSVALK
jgi:thioredoxin 1